MSKYKKIYYPLCQQPNCCLKIDFQKVDQHAGGKWLIHDSKRRKDNQLQMIEDLSARRRYQGHGQLITSRGCNYLPLRPPLNRAPGTRDLLRCLDHDDVIKWKHFPRYWPFVRGIHRSPVNSPHKGQWREALMFLFICARINNHDAGDLRRHRIHYDVIVMYDPQCNHPLRDFCLSSTRQGCVVIFDQVVTNFK